MSLTGQVTASIGLRVRNGPGVEHTVLGLLKPDERLTLFELVGEWWRVDSQFGPGFVHAAFVALVPVDEETPHATEILYVCVPGDTLGQIGLRFGVNFLDIAALNGIVEPFMIRVGQLLRIPAVGSIQPVAGMISVMNPFIVEGQTEITSSSLQGHHTPWLGSCSVDLDVRGIASPGVAVHFNVDAPIGVDVRGKVQDVGLACFSRRLEDGGRTVKLGIERRSGGGTWVETGAWVLYAHLDPVRVEPHQVVVAGQSLGVMGPPSGPEYASACAQGSHVHIEASQATCVVNERSLIVRAPVITFDG